ncbi:hypothetical protein SCB49_02524 [unidentified eubacterium SCB49]|nr:hypothetical protein SCB49_02524 [unidentified eubacterium SCB49]
MYNLEKLLNKYSVEIPIIQRDYAQGRENTKVDRIRNGFVEALLNVCFSSQSQTMHLDFIYGKIESQSIKNVQESNYNHVESILSFARAYTAQTKVGLSGDIPKVKRELLESTKAKMMPLDGQQRLTTLWLLHYVLYHQSGQDFPEWMSNFSYKTRKSSASFTIGLLTHKKMDPSIVYSEIIKKSKWFYKAWTQDPTVKGMLVMLDEIQKQIQDFCILKETTFKEVSINCFKQLSLIEFSFLELSEIDVADDIYIKMNDRGKQLSDFEIFKNDLLGYLSELVETETNLDFTKKEYDRYAKNIDNEWHDLFWDLKGIQNFEIEGTIHYYFLYYLLIYKIIKSKKTDTDIDSEYFSSLVGEKPSANFEHLDFKKLKELKLISFESLQFVSKNLKILESENLILTAQRIVDGISFKNENKIEIGNTFLQHFLKPRLESLGYYDRVYHYAISNYLLYFENNFNPELYRNWCRVLQNLIYNQAYIQDKSTFETAIKNVTNLLECGDDIEKTLLEEDQNISVFSRQLSEEKEKIRIYKKVPELYNQFTKYEGHPYFHGQIGFLIDLSKNENSKIDIAKLSDYGDKLSKIFLPKNLDNKEFLFARSLLTFKNYFHSKSSNRWQFFSNNNALRNKEEGWRLLMNKTKELEIIKTLLDKISVDNWDNDLLEIIKNYESEQWKYYFVKESRLWQLGSENMFRKKNNNVRLWRTSRGYGEQYELRTKFLEYTWDIDSKPFNEIKYVSVNSEQDQPCAYLTGWNRKEFSYHLDIRYYENQYELRFLNVNKVTNYRIEKEILILLKELKFENDKEKGWIYCINYDGRKAEDQNMKLKIIETMTVFNNIEDK